MSKTAAKQPATKRLPVSIIAFHEDRKFSGIGGKNAASSIRSIPDEKKAYFLIDHFPGRRQYRVVYVRPNRKDFEESWIPEGSVMRTDYVETTYVG